MTDYASIAREHLRAHRATLRAQKAVAKAEERARLKAEKAAAKAEERARLKAEKAALAHAKAVERARAKAEKAAAREIRVTPLTDPMTAFKETTAAPPSGVTFDPRGSAGYRVVLNKIVMARAILDILRLDKRAYERAATTVFL